MRRVGATLTQILELEPSKEHAVGGLTATGASKEANDIRRGMPTMYNGRRATMEEMAKASLWATIVIFLLLKQPRIRSSPHGKTSTTSQVV